MVGLIKESILNQYVIYKNPKDYPGMYVIRKWEIQPGGLVGTNEVFAKKTLKEIRGLVPPGLFKMERDAKDDPCIYEVWV